MSPAVLVLAMVEPVTPHPRVKARLLRSVEELDRLERAIAHDRGRAGIRRPD